MKKLMIFFLAGILMAGTVKITSPKAGENWIIGWGPYEIRWEFSNFTQPSKFNLEIYLNSCRIASGVPLTFRGFFWIPWGNCVGEKGGTFTIKIKWEGGEAESGKFYLTPLPYGKINLNPDKLIYSLGESVTLKWDKKRGKGNMTLWRGDERFCFLGEVDLSQGFLTWKIGDGCGKNLMGKYFYLVILPPDGEAFMSHVFKIVGEMPPPRRR